MITEEQVRAAYKEHGLIPASGFINTVATGNKCCALGALMGGTGNWIKAKALTKSPDSWAFGFDDGFNGAGYSITSIRDTEEYHEGYAIGVALRERP